MIAQINKRINLTIANLLNNRYVFAIAILEFCMWYMLYFIGMRRIMDGSWTGILSVGISVCLLSMSAMAFDRSIDIKHKSFGWIPVALAGFFMLASIIAINAIGVYLLYGVVALILPVYILYRVYNVYLVL